MVAPPASRVITGRGFATDRAGLSGANLLGVQIDMAHLTPHDPGTKKTPQHIGQPVIHRPLAGQTTTDHGLA